MLRFNDCPLKYTDKLTSHEANLFQILDAFETGKTPKGASEIWKEIEESFPYRLMQKRLKVANAEVADTVVALCALLTDTPGDTVLWAANLAIEAAERGPINSIHDLKDIYPAGMPNRTWRAQCWASQKKKGAPNANLLDTVQFWKNPLRYVTETNNPKNN